MKRCVLRLCSMTLAGAAALALSACGSSQVKQEPLTTISAAAPDAGAPAAAEPGAYWRNRDDLIEPPEVVPPAPIEAGPTKELKLQNELPILLMPDPTLPLVTVRLVLRTGSIDDPPDKVGLAQFTADMLRQGIRGMSADAISRTVDSAGVSLVASSGYELTGVACSGRAEALDLCLRMVSALVSRPTFPAKEMAEVRDGLLSGVKQTRDEPGALADAHFDNMLFGDDHPAGRPITETSIRSIDRADLVRFHREHYTPASALLGVTGDIDPDRLQQALRRRFGRWSKRPVPQREIEPLREVPAGMRVLLVDNPALSQAFFTMGHGGIRRDHPDRFAVTVMNYVLGGGGFSSRLMEVVRAEGGKTYGISSGFARATRDGSFQISSFTRNEQLLETLGLVRQELRRMIDKPPTEQEVRAASGKIAGGYVLQIPTTEALMNRLMRARLHGLPDSEVLEYPAKIADVDAAEAGAAARKHLHPGRLLVSIVGKAAEVAPQLDKAGIPYQTVDYLAPISAAERARLAAEAAAPVSDQDPRMARRVLEKALETAGGRARLKALRTLSLRGKATVSAQSETMEGSFSASVIYPDHMRLALDVKPFPMKQVLVGKRAYIEISGQRKDLPPEVVQRLQATLWREPPRVILHALGEGVRARIAAGAAGRTASQVAVEVLPPDLPPTTLIFDRATHRLIAIRHTTEEGQQRESRLDEHRPVGRILFPHRVTTELGDRKQSLHYEEIEVNPRITPKEITAP